MLRSVLNGLLDPILLSTVPGARADFGIPTFWDPPKEYLYGANPTYHDCHTTSIDHGNQTEGWCKTPHPAPRARAQGSQTIFGRCFWCWGFVRRPCSAGTIEPSPG